MKWLLKGDCHGNFIWLDNIDKEQYPSNNTAIIILGDAGLNFYLNKTDEKMKKWISERGYHLYCVRGNHEARPRDVPGMGLMSDSEVKGIVEVQAKYPNIRYLLDGYTYQFGQYKCLCIGGAYSVDKWYRLARGGYTEETNDPKKTGWFPNEQLTYAEMSSIQQDIYRIKVDFVFTHTCPLSFQPTDLFLGFIDQSKVDNTMEYWMEQIKDTFEWKVWCFGHYHADRLERPFVEQYYKDIEDLDTIWHRWENYTPGEFEEWWLIKSPNFYMK
jgi:3-oxoacid CoA-transferase subunit A